MKTIKPEKLGVLQRVFENDHKCYLALGVLVGTNLRTPKTIVSEVGVWKIAGEELGSEGGILDEAFPKPSGEVLVNGKCFAPGGKAVPATTIRVQLGPVDKRLAVFGDRTWQNGNSTAPVPFTEMPLDWTRSFGAKDHLANPLGRGASPVESEDGKRVHPLPNLELPSRLIVATSDKPTPAGLGALDLSRSQRQARAGTYDRAWMETRSPGLPVDFDLSFFHTALEDQWIPGFFAGNERFLLENLHPRDAKLEGQLPGLVVRAFVVLRVDLPPDDPDAKVPVVPRSAMREVPLRIDTVRLFPHHELALCIHRGVVEVAEDDADDVAYFLVAAEDPSAPRDVDHYHQVLTMRLDAQKYPWALLRDSDLMPPVSLGWDSAPDKGDIVDIVHQEDLLKKNARRGMNAQLDQRRTELEAKGLWDQRPPDEEEDLDLEAAMKKFEAAEKRAEEEKKIADARAEELTAKARESFAKQGIDYDAEVAKAKKEGAGPPKFKAASHVKQMREVAQAARDAGSPMPDLERQIHDPAWEAHLFEQEQRLIGAYRRGAHLQEPVEEAPHAASELIRGELVAAKANGASLAGRDFTGADLSELDLSGIDLSGALLESAVFTHTILRGAKLRGAVLAHADIGDAVLERADLSGANLGGATFDGADLRGADLSDALLSKARLDAVKLAGAKLSRTQLFETVFGEGVDFGEALGHQLLFFKVDLRGCRFAGAVLEHTNFLECDLSGCDFSGADLRRCGFLKVQMPGANLAGARLDHATFVLGTSLAGATLERATGTRANFRECDMREAKLAGATLPESDLSKANLTLADLRGVVLRGAMMMRTDLTEANVGGADLLGAILSKATFVGADFRGANFFSADLSRVRVDGRTKIDRADLRRARVHPKRREGGSFGGPR